MEFTFRTPNGRLKHVFSPATSLHEVKEVLGKQIGAVVAELLVGFPPKRIEGKTLEAISNNEVITIAEGKVVEKLMSFLSFSLDKDYCTLVC